MLKFLYNLIKDFLAMFAAVATIISLLYTIADHVLPKEFIVNSFVGRSQSKIAEFIAPSGYVVIPKTLEFVPKNSDFLIGLGQSVLLTEDKKITFSTTSVDYNGVWVELNGENMRIDMGKHIKIPNTKSYIWLYKRDDRYSNNSQGSWDEKVDKDKFYFQLRDGE